MTTAIRLEEPMTLTSTDQLAEASATRALADTKPVRELTERVRRALERYEESAVERARRRLTNRMLEAIGQSMPAVAEEHESVEASELLGALAELTPMLLPPPSVSAVVRVVPALAPAPVPDAPSSSTSIKEVPAPVTLPTPREATPEEIFVVEGLLVEVKAVDATVVQQPRARLVHQVKAIAAEVRQALGTFPHSHPLRWKLEALPSTLHLLCQRVDMQEFINGIGNGASGDWAAVSKKERQALKAFDEQMRRPKTPPAPTPKPKRGLATLGDVLGARLNLVPSTTPLPLRWPLLREQLGGEKLLIVGGLSRPERIRAIEGRAGFGVEWEAIDKNSPRQVENIVRRLEGGNLAACVIAEGVMSHKDYRRIDAACKSARNRTPLLVAFCHRGGTAQIDEALDFLEKQIAGRS